MRFDITTAINVRNAMFLDVKPCFLADRRQISEENTSCIFHNRSVSLEDRGRKIFRNVGIYLSNYTVVYSRRQIFKTYYPFSQIIKLFKS